MKLESNATQITRRGFLILGAAGAAALVTPHRAFALDGVPTGVSGDLSSIVVEPIENGWRVRNAATGEVGTVVFPSSGRDSIVTMPDGEVIVTRWNDDGTVTQNGAVIGGPEPHIAPFASIPAGYEYHITIHYDFTGYSYAMAIVELAAICLTPAAASAVINKIIAAGGVVNGMLGAVKMDVDQYINWSNGLFYNVYRIYIGDSYKGEYVVGPLSSTRPV